MSFAPVARWRNFTIGNIIEVLKAYKEVPENVNTDQAEQIIEQKINGYIRTAYQICCQMCLQKREKRRKYLYPFTIHKYLLGLDTKSLNEYMTFWFKTYYAPNPYVSSQDSPCLIYLEICNIILNEPGNRIGISEIFTTLGLNTSYKDIIKNIIINYGQPVRYENEYFSIDQKDISYISKEIEFLTEFAKIPADYQNNDVFFNRCDEARFNEYCSNIKQINNDLKSVKDVNIMEIVREAEEQISIQRANVKIYNEEEIVESNNRTPELTDVITKSYKTDIALKKSVIQREEYRCQFAKFFGQEHKTFLNKTDQPYMEGHHIIPMSAQNDFTNINLDRTENIICLCPSCHKAVHYGNKSVVEQYLRVMYDIKKKELQSANIYLSLEDILKYYTD